MCQSFWAIHVLKHFCLRPQAPSSAVWNEDLRNAPLCTNRSSGPTAAGFPPASHAKLLRSRLCRCDNGCIGSERDAATGIVESACRTRKRRPPAYRATTTARSAMHSLARRIPSGPRANWPQYDIQQFLKPLVVQSFAFALLGRFTCTFQITQRALDVLPSGNQQSCEDKVLCLLQLAEERRSSPTPLRQNSRSSARL